MFGVNLLAGYRFTKAHALSTGVELLNDGYMKEELRRGGSSARYQQATWLAGYELWQGRVAFTAHFGWNVVRPGPLSWGRVAIVRLPIKNTDCCMSSTTA